MKIIPKFFIILIVIISCKTQPVELNYIKNIEEVALKTSIENSKTNIQIGDELIISIAAKDMNVVKPFNQNYESKQGSELTTPNGNIMNTPVTNTGPTYKVDFNGDIDFPIIGKISTTNKTIEQFKESLKSQITKYVKNPTVSVKHINFKVVLLGEVQKPGTYQIPDGNVTILTALGLAGDFTEYGVRKNVLIVRNIDGETTKQMLDLTDANFFNSPYYYLKQNDVVYVAANEIKQRNLGFDPKTNTYISVISLGITVLSTLLIVIFKK